MFDAVGELAANQPADLPVLVLCRRDTAAVVRFVGVSNEQAAAIARVAVISQPTTSPREVTLEQGPSGPVWPEPVSTLIASSVGSNEHVLAFGISPRLPLDRSYRGYVEQITEQVTSALLRIDSANASQAVNRERDNLLTKAPVATALLTGPRHVYQLANPLYCRVVGRNPIGQAHGDAFPELRDTELPAILDRVYQTGEPFAASEMRLPLERDGAGATEDCYFNFNLEALRDEADRVYGMMAIAVDITEQVRARQALEKIGEERDRVLAALEKANRTKDDFLAMLGHELRNPLAPIVTAVELMNAKDANGDGSAEREIIARQLKRVVRLVDDLLDISKITRGVLTLDKRRVDLAAVLNEAIETVAHLFSQREHRLITSFPDGVFVSGDESRLVQVVSNLLTNAARYTPNAGQIRLSATVTSSAVVVEVSDNGSGIASELLPNLFDSFVQGERSANRAEGGLGLGLAIVKTIVALHGGDVSVKSLFLCECLTREHRVQVVHAAAA